MARIFDNSSHSLVQSFSSVSIDSVKNIVIGDSCYTPPGICLQVVYYSSLVILPPNPNGYYITWKVCCKSFEGNFQGSNSQLFYAQFPNPLLSGKNQSPKFNPIGSSPYFCIGYEKELDFSCRDIDRDSLVYSLITPYKDFSITGSKPFVVSTYKSGFDMNKMLGPGSTCEIDSTTGIVLARPAQLGIFSISVICEEYRNGIKLGEVTRTFVASSLNCNFGIPVYFENIPSSYEFELGKKNCFDIVASSNYNSELYLNFSSTAFSNGAKVSLPDSNANGKYDFEWENAFFENIETTNDVEVIQTSSTQFFANRGKVGARFCWELADCELREGDKYFVDAKAILDRCGMTDTANIQLTINFEGPESSIYTPNSFSPNGDGIEDVFRLKNEANECLEITQTKIYDLMGNLVFESDNPNFFWNGKNFLDKHVSSGIYMVVYEGNYGSRKEVNSFKLLLYR